MRTKMSRGLRDAAVPLLAVIGALLVAWEARLGADPRGPLQQPYPILGVGFSASALRFERSVGGGFFRPASFAGHCGGALLPWPLVGGFSLGGLRLRATPASLIRPSHCLRSE